MLTGHTTLSRISSFLVGGWKEWSDYGKKPPDIRHAVMTFREQKHTFINSDI